MRMSMKSRLPMAAAVAAIGLLLSSPSFAQNPRGTLIATNGNVLTVETPKGTEDIKLASDVRLFLVTKADMSAIQTGKFVGITSVERNGKRVAREVHVFAEALRGLAEGHYPWDLETEPNMMTNANIAQIESVGADKVLKVAYSGGEQVIAVPDNAVIVGFDNAGPEQLEKGRKVFVIMKKDVKEAAFVVIGAPGVKPPM